MLESPKRTPYTVCHNLKCSICDPRGRICMTNIEVCAQRQPNPPTLGAAKPQTSNR